MIQPILKTQLNTLTDYLVDILNDKPISKTVLGLLAVTDNDIEVLASRNLTYIIEKGVIKRMCERMINESTVDQVERYIKEECWDDVMDFYTRDFNFIMPDTPTYGTFYETIIKYIVYFHIHVNIILKIKHALNEIQSRNNSV